MNKYLVIIEGEGEGCDYTIGCNIRWDFYDAESLEDLKEQIIKRWYSYEDAKEEEYYAPEIGVGKAIIVQADLHCEMDDIHEIALKRVEKTISDERDSKEKKEYERLKKKFG